MFHTFIGMASLTPSSNFETSQLRENSSLDKSHSQWHKTPKAHLIFSHAYFDLKVKKKH